MNLYVVDTGFFKLDGGAMFGVVPKALWSKTNPADGNNLCTWAMRCLLVEDNGRYILIDNGIGLKQDQKFLNHYHLHGSASLPSSLKKLGISPSQITDNILTHLHFDHCGGGIVHDTFKDQYRPFFENASYWSNEDHWHWATKPNPREKASFLKENILPMEESGQLAFIKLQTSPFENISFLFVDGHTDKQMIPHIRYKDRTIVFAADLLPSVGHIPLPYVMGYDTRPLLTMEEKSKFLTAAADNGYIIFLQHDPLHECCTVMHTEKGVRLKETFTLKKALADI